MEATVVQIENDSFRNEDEWLSSPILLSEVKKLCGQLRNGKAPGWDNVTQEHVKHGGKKLIKCLTLTIQYNDPD